MKNVQKIDLGLTGYDELFMNDAERKENRLPRIYDIPISEIDDFPDHPFKVKVDEDTLKEPETKQDKEDGMDDKRMIGDYTVLNSMYVGHKEIAICENQKAAKDERYLCCYIESVIVFERYTEALVSDDFAEIAQVFGERIASAAEEIIKETEKANEQVGANAELTASDCAPVTWEDSIENKVIAIKGNTLRPEFCLTKCIRTEISPSVKNVRTNLKSALNCMKNCKPFCS